MRWSNRRALGVLLAGLLAAQGGIAGDMEDLSLTVAVRKALSRDEKLAGLSLGATAANGRVTIWGPAPSGDLAAYAQAVVKEIAGVKSVANEIHIRPPLAASRHIPGRTRADLPEPIVLLPLPGLLDLPGKARPDFEKERPALAIAPEAPGHTAAKETLAPAPLIRASSALLPPDSVAMQTGLAAQIDAILSRNPRHDGLNATIQSGLVRLSGTMPSWNELWPLTEEVSKLPGVKRVVVDKITIR